MEGCHFQELEESLADLTANQMQQDLTTAKLMYGIPAPYSDVENVLGWLWPSNNFFRNIFLVDYSSKREVYRSDMSNIIGDMVSMDHTFKMSSNIGYEREDGVWVSLYDNFFLMLNENGRVMDYKFTKSTSYDNVQDIMQFKGTFTESRC